MLVVPVYNMLLVPESTVFFQLDQLKESAGSKGISLGERVIFIIAKEKDSQAALSEDSFYPIGVSGTITETVRATPPFSSATASIWTGSGSSRIIPFSSLSPAVPKSMIWTAKSKEKSSKTSCRKCAPLPPALNGPKPPNTIWIRSIPSAQPPALSPPG